MVLGFFPTRPVVPRRKNRPYESDDRNCPAGGVVDAIDIPPSVAVGGNGDIEVWSFKIASAACLAESVAIGIPAPGWVPPPARYRPGITVRLEGRRREAVRPCGLCP